MKSDEIAQRPVRSSLPLLRPVDSGMYYASRNNSSKNLIEAEVKMLVECIPRPELRAPVLELIGRVQREHATGTFTIALAEMFASFGLSLEEGEWVRLRLRGDVRFAPQSSSQGAFINQGGKLELATDEGLTIVIPQVLSGDYITTPTSLTLKFAEGAALRGCKRVFVLICQDIIKIDADEHKLYIDLPGEKYDLCFVF